MIHGRQFIKIVSEKLAQQDINTTNCNFRMADCTKHSAILFLLGPSPQPPAGKSQIGLFLTKRSGYVRQSGDLCCPGGGISLPQDIFWSKLLKLSFSPLRRWCGWPEWHRKHPNYIAALALLLAASIREAWEEMRLNPFGIRFLGPLPQHHILLLDRIMHPMAAWTDTLATCKINWEVERLVHIPLHRLLDVNHYGCFRPMTQATVGHPTRYLHDVFLPCFVHHDSHGAEVLWGGTFRVVQSFLKIIFGFELPPTEKLPVINKFLSPDYPNGILNSINHSMLNNLTTKNGKCL